MSVARLAAPRTALDQLRLAVSFLTVIPVRVARPVALGEAAAWFPAVGVLIGAFAGGVRVGAEPVVGATAATVVALIALVGATGALHQDGLADTADGLGVRGDTERRLEVMRDPVIGTFGVLALVGWALLMLAALAPLSQREALAALIAAGALSRWAALLHAAAAPPARADGLGAGFRVGRGAMAAATASAVAATLLAAGPVPGLTTVAVTLALGLASAWAARRVIGGRTGDTIGATVAIVEAAACLTLLSWWR